MARGPVRVECSAEELVLLYLSLPGVGDDVVVPVPRKLTERNRILRESIAWAIQQEGVPQRLAARIALQLLMKFDVRDLGGASTRRGIGQLLRDDIDRLQSHLGLVERQLIVAPPKLSAKQIEDFVAELKASDASIARTILNAALDAADPFTTARRYLAEFHAVVKQFRRPRITMPSLLN